MPWGKATMTSKKEFVFLAQQPEANIRQLCRQFEVSPTTGYALLKRYEAEQDVGLLERSRRPLSSPRQTEERLERSVLALRDETHWGARKLARRLSDQGKATLHPNTVHSILKRNGRIDAGESAKRKRWHRFEHPEPNDLGQLDFKGWIPTGKEPCHPLTMVDDHSRFCLCLEACADETTVTVKERLTKVFRRYGLPWRMTMDNGAPWGDEGGPGLTQLTAWLVRMGVAVSHSRPYHPQTQGKDERLHESLNAELLRWVVFRDLVDAQEQFDRWRDRYNMERPHEALNMATPITRYRPSPRTMPEPLPPIEYDCTDDVRMVDQDGKIHYRRQTIRVGRGCRGMPVAIRPTTTDGLFEVFFCSQRIRTIDLHADRRPSVPADSRPEGDQGRLVKPAGVEEGLTNRS